MTKPNFLNALRAQTNDKHKALETLPLSQAIISHELTKQQYDTYIARMYGFLAFVETQYFPMLEAIFHDLPKRKKAYRILEDLKRIQLDQALLIKDFPAFFQKNDTDTIAYALGVLYVTEGSTLGGRMILKNVQKSLGYDAENGASYFAGYGAETAAMWKIFLDNLLVAEKDLDRTAIIKGANDAFSAIHSYLKK